MRRSQLIREWQSHGPNEHLRVTMGRLLDDWESKGQSHGKQGQRDRTTDGVYARYAAKMGATAYC